MLVILSAVAVGWLAGGRLDGLARVELRRGRLLFFALVCQLVGAMAAQAVSVMYAVGMLGAAGFAAAFLARNRDLPGIGLVAAGLLLNALVVTANGAMPVSLYAAARAGVPVTALDLADNPRHEEKTAETRLGLLADVVPVPLPLRPEVDSPGDVLFASGLALLIVSAMRRRPEEEPVPPQTPSRVERSMTRESVSTTRGSYS